MKLLSLALILLAVVFLSAGLNDSTQEVAPYQFAQMDETKFYKTVHEGCEIFLARSNAWSSGQPTIAIATGRGCR